MSRASSSRDTTSCRSTINTTDGSFRKAVPMRNLHLPRVAHVFSRLPQSERPRRRCTPRRRRPRPVERPDLRRRRSLRRGVGAEHRDVGAVARKHGDSRDVASVGVRVRARAQVVHHSAVVRTRRRSRGHARGATRNTQHGTTAKGLRSASAASTSAPVAWSGCIPTIAEQSRSNAAKFASRMPEASNERLTCAAFPNPGHSRSRCLARGERADHPISAAMAAALASRDANRRRDAPSSSRRRRAGPRWCTARPTV